MIICAAIDDNMGMMFNNRRQSQDKLLRKHLLEITQPGKLWMNSYSEKQFETPLEKNIIVDEEFLEKAGEEDFCFVENLSVADYTSRIKKIILFKWNRVYPADMYFDISLTENNWKRISALDFEGNSHKQITMEVWKNV